mmetsp:Transcript_23860/g.81348  ORF Transcript_23860/g.81348 Transcript_23860/m.81348 type:complete len:241 (+) Transcript_23860:4279-5001(+)
MLRSVWFERMKRGVTVRILVRWYTDGPVETLTLNSSSCIGRSALKLLSAPTLPTMDCLRASSRAKLCDARSMTPRSVYSASSSPGSCMRWSMSSMSCACVCTPWDVTCTLPFMPTEFSAMARLHPAFLLSTDSCTNALLELNSTGSTSTLTCLRLRFVRSLTESPRPVSFTSQYGANTTSLRLCERAWSLFSMRSLRRFCATRRFLSTSPAGVALPVSTILCASRSPGSSESRPFPSSRS